MNTMHNMPSLRKSVCLFVLFGVAGSTSTISAVEFDDLLKRIPESANAIVVMDVNAIFSSPLAQSEGWRERYADNYGATPLILPPKATRFLLAAELDIETLSPSWEVASLELSLDRTAEEISEHIGGVVDSLAGTEVVWPTSEMCVARFSANQLGAISPASRQAAGRWIQSSKRQGQHSVSPYIRQAVGYATGAGPEIIMAIDLEHLLRPSEIRASVDRSDILRDLDKDEVTELLSSLRGVTLGVRVANRISGKLIADFGVNAGLLEPVAKPMMLKVLSNLGATLDELEDWSPQVDGKRVSIQGRLTTDGMRRLFSIVSMDTAIVSREKENRVAEKPDISDKDRIAKASSRYFGSVTKYLNDLQRPSRKKQTLSDKALWARNYARRIEKLSKRNVDSDLAAYGEQVAYRLRDAVAHAHGIAQDAAEQVSRIRPKSDVRIGGVPTANVNNYGGYRVREYAPMAFGRVDVASALQERQAVTDAALQQGNEIALRLMEQIQYDTEQIRVLMSERYGVKF